MTDPMPHVLVLTARRGSAALTGDLVRRVCRDAGLQVPAGRWLAPGEAWEAELRPQAFGAMVTARSDAQRVLAGEPIDVNVVAVPATGRRKRLLVSDMDSTIIQQECIDEMADMAGLKPRIAAITERAMRGELDFEAALRERLGLLAGLGEPVLERVFAERIRLMPGARTLTCTMRANGAATVLVSGGFSYFTERVAAAAGFDAEHANQLEMREGRLTGGVVGPILGRGAKLALLRDHAQRRGLGVDETLAVGDGANDLAMIGAAGLGVAYRAKPVVADQAAASIVHGDLTALLYLQGYARADFSEA